MNSVITKTQKTQILILGGVTALFGAVAGSIGLFLRTELTSSKQSWEVDGLPQFTDGYFGVISGFLLFLLGTVGAALVYPRVSCLLFLYGFLSLSCDVLCVFDALMLMPYTKDNGKFAWEDHECNFNTTIDAWGNITTTTAATNLQDIKGLCDDIEVIGILLICTTAAVLITFVLSTATTVLTAVALCKARAVTDSSQSGHPLSSFTVPEIFEVTNYNNALYQNNGYRS